MQPAGEAASAARWQYHHQDRHLRSEKHREDEARGFDHIGLHCAAPSLEHARDQRADQQRALFRLGEEAPYKIDAESHVPRALGHQGQPMKKRIAEVIVNCTLLVLLWIVA